MTSLIEQYEQQYAVSTADFTAKIAKLANVERSDRRFLIQELEKQVEELRELLEQMELEVCDVDPTLRPKLKTRVESYRAELVRLEKEFSNASIRKNGYGDQNEIFGEISIREEQKQQLLNTSETIERTNNKLTACYSVLLESEDIGSQVLRDLQCQRETIQKSRARLREADADLSRSTRIMNLMIARSRQHKLVISVIAAVCSLAILVTIYFSVTRSS
ncbi:vesicle transport through interaction with t-SNAREs homolog 1A isoform X2 [Halyomorpha halys]|uniref:vesicle transport through interaction with t-SNAREs homolog 1A isoform X2 n=1 Tax=Halyomorpha halys TaxID=286706 RepID=UPI0034D302BC